MHEQCVQNTSDVLWPICNLFNPLFYCATILSDAIAHAAEVMVVISCDSALSKIHICLSICPGNLYCLFLYVYVLVCVCAHSPSCTWPGTWPCRFWVIITTSSLPPTFWTSPWALRHFAPSFPLSHTMGNRCVLACVFVCVGAVCL